MSYRQTITYHCLSEIRRKGDEVSFTDKRFNALSVNYNFPKDSLTFSITTVPDYTSLQGLNLYYNKMESYPKSLLINIKPTIQETITEQVVFINKWVCYKDDTAKNLQIEYQNLYTVSIDLPTELKPLERKTVDVHINVKGSPTERGDVLLHYDIETNSFTYILPVMILRIGSILMHYLLPQLEKIDFTFRIQIPITIARFWGNIEKRRVLFKDKIKVYMSFSLYSEDPELHYKIYECSRAMTMLPIFFECYTLAQPLSDKEVVLNENFKIFMKKAQFLCLCYPAKQLIDFLTIEEIDEVNKTIYLTSEIPTNYEGLKEGVLVYPSVKFILNSYDITEVAKNRFNTSFEFESELI